MSMTPFLTRLVCAGLCLAAVTPAAPPRTGSAEAGSGAGEAIASSAPGAGEGVAVTSAERETPDTPEQWLHARLSGRRSAAGRIESLVDRPHPKPWLRPTLMAAALRDPSLSSTAAPPAPRAAPTELSALPPARPAIDLPPIVAHLDVPLPSKPFLATPPAPRLATRDPIDRPPPSLTTGGGADRPTVAFDPTPSEEPAALAASTPPRNAPAPPLLLSIPTPSPFPPGAFIATPAPPEPVPFSIEPLPAKPTLTPG